MDNKFSLRKKFLIFTLFLLAVTGLLIYVINSPYREMKKVANGIESNINRIIMLENIVRETYRIQHEVILYVLHLKHDGISRNQKPFRIETDELMKVLSSDLGGADDPGGGQEDIKALSNDIRNASIKILKMSLDAAASAEKGKIGEAIKMIEQVDDIADNLLIDKTDRAISHLEAKVRAEFPQIFTSLQHAALVPVGDARRKLDDVSIELEHAIQFQKMARFFYGQYKELLDILAGSRPETDHTQFENFRRKIDLILAEWKKGETESRQESENIEDEEEMRAIRETIPLFERMQGIGGDIFARRAASVSDRNIFNILSELDSINATLDARLTSLVRREDREIKEKVEEVIGLVSRSRYILTMISLIIAAAGVFTLWLMFNNIIAPVIRLRDASVRIGRGDFNAAVHSASNDEIGELAGAFEGMRLNLLQGISELKDEIASRKRAESEKEQVIRELQEALGRIRTLSGLLPICASCKKIKDDKGYWNQIESYVSEHSEAEFSHGYCPECAAKFREEIAKLKIGR